MLYMYIIIGSNRHRTRPIHRQDMSYIGHTRYYLFVVFFLSGLNPREAHVLLMYVIVVRLHDDCGSPDCSQDATRPPY